MDLDMGGSFILLTCDNNQIHFEDLSSYVQFWNVKTTQNELFPKWMLHKGHNIADDISLFLDKVYNIRC